MYEVMEVMRDRNYKNKIFPVVSLSENEHRFIIIQSILSARLG